MPHRRTPEEVCRGKVRFAHRKQALGALNNVLASGNLRNGKPPTGVYKCRVPGCAGWHLTSRPVEPQERAA